MDNPFNLDGKPKNNKVGKGFIDAEEYLSRMNVEIKPIEQIASEEIDIGSDSNPFDFNNVEFGKGDSLKDFIPEPEDFTEEGIYEEGYPKNEVAEGVKEEFSDNTETNTTQEREERSEGKIEPQRAPKGLKVKEVHCGVTILTNIGDYENVKSKFEVVADIESNDEMKSSIEFLQSELMNMAREEYVKVKNSTMKKQMW